MVRSEAGPAELLRSAPPMDPPRRGLTPLATTVMVQYEQANSRRKVASVCVVIGVFDNGDDTFALVIRHKHERIPKGHFETKLALFSIEEKRSGNKFGPSLIH